MRRRRPAGTHAARLYNYCASRSGDLGFRGRNARVRAASGGMHRFQKKKSGGMHARDRTKRGSCTYVRPRRGIACLAPAPPPVDRPRGRSSGGDRETRASPWHKKPRGSRHAAVVVRPRSGPFGAPDTSDPWRVSGAPKPCQLVGVIVSHHVRIQ
jgi:hypothetical protein